jgi:hypothetical protein
MKYVTLREAALEKLRRDRVHELEVQHYNSQLLLDELESAGVRDDQILRQLAELERRIALHLAELQRVEIEAGAVNLDHDGHDPDTEIRPPVVPPGS